MYWSCYTTRCTDRFQRVSVSVVRCVAKAIYFSFKTRILLILDSPRSRASTFAYTEDNHTSVLGMRELAPSANLLCLARGDKAYRALTEGPSSAPRDDDRARSGNSLFAYPAQSNFAGAKYPLEWIETCRSGALDRYTRGCSKYELLRKSY